MFIYNSSNDINNCVFKNFYTPYYGGIFYLYYPRAFTANKIDIYNSTAMYGV